MVLGFADMLDVAVQASQVDKKKYPIFAAAEKDWAAHKGDCSGYVRAVGADVGVPMSGLANELVDFWNRDPGWIKLGHDALKASLMSGQGYLVVAGKKGKRHGHVVIVVPGESARHDVMGYWGNLSGVGEKDESLSKAWTRADLKGVEYFARPVPALAPKP